MPLPRCSTVVALVAATLFSCPGRAADSDLTRMLPANTGFALHVRNLADLLANWEHTPFARTWNEPEVQKFFAPLREQFDREAAGKLAAKFQADTGMTPREVLGLFPGEVVVATLDFAPYVRNEQSTNPQLIVAAQVGPNRAKIEDLMHKSAEKQHERLVEEEFQGETLHITMKPTGEDGKEREAEAWAMVGDVFLTAEPKTVLQQVIANLKRGGAADSLADAPDFAAIYRRHPDTDVALFFNIEALVPAIVDSIKARDAKREAAAAPSTMDQFGVTPDVMVHAFGLDALTSLHVAAHVGRENTTIATGLQWREQRGLLRMLAFGDPPAPEAAFVPDTWLAISCARFSIPGAYAALKDTLAEASPALEAMVQERIKGINAVLGIDIERDLIASIGDEFTRAEALPPGAADNDSAPKSTDNFVGLSLINAEAFKNAIEAIKGMVPGMAKLIVPREYLGETINTLTPRVSRRRPNGAPSAGGFSYAITQNHFFVSVGSPAMVESAVQGQNGATNSLWRRPEVGTALGELPPGGSLVFYYDARRLATLAFDMLAASPMRAPRRTPAPDDGGDTKPPALRFWDPAAKPSAGAIEKHWKSAAGAVYRDADGIRGLFHIQHVE